MQTTRCASSRSTCPSKPAGAGSPSRAMKRYWSVTSSPYHGLWTVTSVLRLPAAPVISNPEA